MSTISDRQRRMFVFNNTLLTHEQRASGLTLHDWVTKNRKKIDTAMSAEVKSDTGRAQG